MNLCNSNDNKTYMSKAIDRQPWRHSYLHFKISMNLCKTLYNVFANHIFYEYQWDTSMEMYEHSTDFYFWTQEFNADAIKLSIEFDGHQRIAELLYLFLYQRKPLQNDIRIFRCWFDSTEQNIYFMHAMWVEVSKIVE